MLFAWQCGAVIALLLLICPSQWVGAQSPHKVKRPAAQILSAFVDEAQNPGEGRPGTLELVHMLTYPDDYRPADIEYLLKGLEEGALTAKAAPVRAEAALALGLIGSKRSTRSQAGVFARLARVYRDSKDPIVRAGLLTTMG